MKLSAQSTNHQPSSRGLLSLSKEAVAIQRSREESQHGLPRACFASPRNDDNKDDSIGHRERIRKKVLHAEPECLDDYEVLEALLCYAIPRKDVKPLAKTLLKEVGNIGKIINAPQQKLRQVKGIGDSSIVLFKLLRDVMCRVTKEQILNRSMVQSWDNLITHIRSKIGYSTIENLYTMYLNNKHTFIADKLHDHGTVNGVSIYPREIVKAALYYDASSVVMVHNHPSGMTEPSKADLVLTKTVQEALNAVDIQLLDHIIISNNSYFSFKKHELV